MHNQRIRLALAAGAALISTFMSWVKFNGEIPKSLIAFLSGGGFFGSLPIIIMLCSLVSLIIPLRGDKTKMISRFKVFRIIPSVICIAIGILLIMTFEHDGDSAAIGLYLNLAASGLYILFTLVDFDNSSPANNIVHNNTHINSPDNPNLSNEMPKKETIQSKILNGVIGLALILFIIYVNQLMSCSKPKTESDSDNKKSSGFREWFSNLETYQQWLIGIAILSIVGYWIYSDAKKWFAKRKNKS